MDYAGRRVLVNDINAMLAFYKNILMAEVLDVSDTFAVIAIEDDIIEFVLGINSVDQTAIAIQYTSEDVFNDACESVLKHQDVSVRLFRNKNTSTYKAELKDVEGNIIQLYHHQLFISIT